ncbi:MAG: hypothetical protein HY744_10490, partial [Deltaproteobacteria bacterium]|nr:hypothetical protein [Deltaproteobacteria bacterium]
VVPKLLFTYEEPSGERLLRVSGSLSLGAGLLEKAASATLGVAVGAESTSSGRLTTSFADPHSPESIEEASRYYAHVVALSAAHHFLGADRDRAVLAASRAVAALVGGVRLGEQAVPASGRTAKWAADAVGALAVAGQQAAEAGQAFLAGDLWTLVLAALGERTTDRDVAAVLSPLPFDLRAVAGIEPVARRAAETLALVASKRPCTRRAQGLDALLSVDCASYPMALALRAADVLPTLPRLRQGAEIGRPRCAAWRALDTFLSTAAEGRYDPDALTGAVAMLRKVGNPHDAAVLLTRQRHPQHCSATLTELGRTLSRESALEEGLRADLLSVVANCSGDVLDDALGEDLLRLEQATRALALPQRNVAAVLFTTQMALRSDRWDALRRMTREPGFVERWLRLGPELGAGALLLHHAATLLAGEALDGKPTLPQYQLLCTTFPSPDRGPACSALGLLRSGAPVSDKKRAARAAVQSLLAQAGTPAKPAGR